MHQKGKRTEKNNNNKELSLRLVTYSDVTRSINLKDKGWDVCIKCIGCFVIILTVVPISAFWKCDGCACSQKHYGFHLIEMILSAVVILPVYGELTNQEMFYF